MKKSMDMMDWDPSFYCCAPLFLYLINYWHLIIHNHLILLEKKIVFSLLWNLTIFRMMHCIYLGSYHTLHFRFFLITI